MRTSRPNPDKKTFGFFGMPVAGGAPAARFGVVPSREGVTMVVVAARKEAGEGMAPLVAAARAGDPRALGELLQAARGYMITIARRRLPADVRPHLAPSDIVQDTAFEAQRGFAGFRGNSEPEFLAWLRGILLHNVGDAVRRRRSHDRAIERVGSAPLKPLTVDLDTARRSPSAHARPTEASAIRRDQAEVVARFVASLGEQAREVVRLRYWENLSFVEIGQRLGRSDSAVRKTWFRAVARLQDELRRGDG